MDDTLVIVRRPDGLLTALTWRIHKLVQRHFTFMPAVFDNNSGWMIDVLQ